MAGVLHGKVQIIGDYRAALGESPIWCDWSATNCLYEIAAEKTRGCMIVGTVFLPLIDSIGSPNTFWLYGVLNVVCIALTVLFVPETKNISLEHIERNLMNGTALRHIGQHEERAASYPAIH